MRQRWHCVQQVCQARLTVVDHTLPQHFPQPQVKILKYHHLLSKFSILRLFNTSSIRLESLSWWRMATGQWWIIRCSSFSDNRWKELTLEIMLTIVLVSDDKDGDDYDDSGLILDSSFKRGLFDIEIKFVFKSMKVMIIFIDQISICI